MYFNKYLKYKRKYLDSKTKRNNLHGGADSRADYEYDVYNVTNEFVKQILSTHGENVKRLYHYACFVIIRLLLEPQHEELLNNIIADHLQSTKNRYTTTVIDINKIKELKKESTDKEIVMWINEHLQNIRSACTFAFLFIQYIRSQRHVEGKAFDSIHYLKTIDQFFAR